jgi:hypothetical protein
MEMKNNIKLKDTIEMICEKWGGDQLQGFTLNSADPDKTVYFTTRAGLEKQGKMIEENFKFLNTDPNDLTSDEQEIFHEASDWMQEEMNSGSYPGTKLMVVLPREDGSFSIESFEIN